MHKKRVQLFSFLSDSDILKTKSCPFARGQEETHVVHMDTLLICMYEEQSRKTLGSCIEMSHEPSYQILTHSAFVIIYSNLFGGKSRGGNCIVINPRCVFVVMNRGDHGSSLHNTIVGGNLFKFSSKTDLYDSLICADDRSE